MHSFFKKVWTMFLVLTRKETNAEVLLNVEIVEKIEAVQGGCKITTGYDEIIEVKDSFESIGEQLKAMGLSA